MTVDPTQEITTTAETLGVYLKRARVERHLTLEDISRVTKYHVNQLNAIEEEDWEKLPTGFVLRSMVKKFALAVDLESHIALEKLAQATGNVVPEAHQRHLRTSINHKVNERLQETSPSYGSSGTWLWIFLILAVLAGIAYIAISQGMINLDEIDFLKKWFAKDV